MLLLLLLYTAVRTLSTHYRSQPRLSSCLPADYNVRPILTSGRDPNCHCRRSFCNDDGVDDDGTPVLLMMRLVRKNVIIVRNNVSVMITPVALCYKGNLTLFSSNRGRRTFVTSPRFFMEITDVLILLRIFIKSFFFFFSRLSKLRLALIAATLTL